MSVYNLFPHSRSEGISYILAMICFVFPSTIHWGEEQIKNELLWTLSIMVGAPRVDIFCIGHILLPVIFLLLILFSWSLVLLKLLNHGTLLLKKKVFLQ